MKILIIGSGGREHAILSTLKRTSPDRPELYCAPGNAGINQISRCVSISATDVAKLAEFASTEHIDLTFVGPEAPLALGIVDEFERRGLTIVGPSCEAARLEASKAFAKDFMQRHAIPTAGYAVADSADEALQILGSGKFGGPDNPIVVKADGLAAGKGVVVAENRRAAEEAVRELTTGGLVDSQAAQKIVIEERLQGTEASLLLFSDGKNYALMPAARDHKRIGEGDTGPNTGGMGAVTDRSILSDALLSEITEKIVERTLTGAREDGFPFRGILFIGLMLTENGPRVLEYNVRFGDPETQAILVRLRTDLSKIFQAMAGCSLADVQVDWSPGSSACVVLASAGYPGKYDSGSVITGLKENRPGVQIFHAGTARSESGEWLTAGGRVLGVTALGESLEQSLDRAYQSIGEISWQGMQFRRDIGKFRGE